MTNPQMTDIDTHSDTHSDTHIDAGAAPLPIYALADPHIGLSVGNTMASFGWPDHPRRLLAAWERTVPMEAIVLIAGDLTVSTRKDDVISDLRHLEPLPGRKFACMGNHDRGPWGTQGGVVRACAEWIPSLTPLKANATRITHAGRGLVICGMRGALAPEDTVFGHPEHQRNYDQAIHRAAAALEEARALREPGDALIAMIHYPPFTNLTEANAFTALIESAGVDLCVYGHLHDRDTWARAVQGAHNGVEYRLTSGDYLNFCPRPVATFGADGLRLEPWDPQGFIDALPLDFAHRRPERTEVVAND